ncbi:MAG TPA: excinuclease ABC subunit A, partial [Flavisolibacter sp.]
MKEAGVKRRKKQEQVIAPKDDSIFIKGARVHNLKNIDVHFPRNKFIVVTGVSGSGKSSLTIDTLFAEGQRRYAESLSAYVRQFLARMDKPDVDYIKGLAPAIAIEQKVITRTPRSTVGSMTEIYDYLRLLFARIGKTISPVSGRVVKKDDVKDVLDAIKVLKEGSKVFILSSFKTHRNRE